jgi:DNA phosphorothioation-associated putative methyltransferase
VGDVEGANLVKLRRDEPKVSYLSYPDFERDPHPALAESLSVHLQTFRLRTRRYAGAKNPPILHRKETVLSEEHKGFAKFARLSRIEEAHGLYENTSVIGTREGWNEALRRAGLKLRGHRLTRG